MPFAAVQRKALNSPSEFPLVPFLFFPPPPSGLPLRRQPFFFIRQPSPPPKLSYVSCYSSARRVHLAALTVTGSNVIRGNASSRLSSSGSSVSGRSPVAKIHWKHKRRKSFETRRVEAENIHSLYPTSIPVVLERASNSFTPVVEKEKFLVPRKLTVGEFELLVRRSCLLTPDQSLYFIVGENMPQNRIKMGDLFDDHSDEDGFLYVSYYIEPTFEYEDAHGRAL